MPAHQTRSATITTLYLETTKGKGAFNSLSYLGVPFVSA